MDTNTVTALLGAALLALPVLKRHVREKRRVADAATDALYMTWMTALRVAGQAQRVDPEITVVLRRYAALAPLGNRS